MAKESMKAREVKRAKLVSSSEPDCDAEGNFQVALTGKITNDGLHLLGKGYQNWVRILKPYLGK